MTVEGKKDGSRPRVTEADLQELMDLIGPPPAAPFPTYDRDGSSDWTPDWDTREVPRPDDGNRGHEDKPDRSGGKDGVGPPPGTPAPRPSKPRRRRSGTARWHMSLKSVSVSLEQVYKLTDREAMDLLVRARFGSWKSVRCPHCGTIDAHYWRGKDRRWTCAGCGSAFSVTSSTVFSNRKLTLQQLIANTLMWLNSAPGQPALELKRHAKTTYNAVFVQQHKLREALVRGYNVGLLAGDVEMDGAHQAGRRSDEKRGRPQISKPYSEDTPADEVEATMLAGADAAKPRPRGKKGGMVDPEHGQHFPEARRILFTVRRRSPNRGEGAVASRVAIGLVEDSDVAGAVMQSFLAVPESTLNTDTSPAYTALGRKFRAHRTVEHSKTMIGPNGENNNQAEELNWRYDRAEKGVYLNIEPKYLLDYASEVAFRADTRRIPNGKQLEVVLGIAMAVGRSEFWTGYTRGRHRDVELLHPGPQAAKPSGPAKGRHPIKGNGRPPR